ncbi:hypothetical protein [Shewanella sp. Isolate7]|uniref:hypothetical protein n=1 Tax=Shewanella sp. Isolate7 TaxID=2908528 RepID=UPI001EFD4C1D|nr:hypothetical protein [Shewanella sp. Isolate7]MCG9722688.1 hypothetical protein [Shewanella sp. Isolate7]
MSTFPASLSDELRIGIQQLIAIHTLNDGASNLASYGHFIKQIYTTVDPAELEATNATMLADMGL